MLFNSYAFIFAFLPATFFIYFFLSRRRLVIAVRGFLVFSSLFFYSWWNIDYLPLLLGSMLFNYAAGVSLSRAETDRRIPAKTVLTLGVVANVALLGYFKYSDFLIENFNGVTGAGIAPLHLALPLAISFFTFQQIAYLVDSYRGETREYDFLNYALFVSFFPQLIAGPIVHHAQMMPQFANLRTHVFRYCNIALGLFIFSMGLFKKVVIADTFAVWANAGYDAAQALTLVEAWATSLSYTFQLYFDFSGYTDMAIGAALLFNIRLPINFDSPYKSTSLIEVWERWHITLSQFVNRYIFRNVLKFFGRYSFVKGLAAVFISMLVIGLWHGASWMFVFFGVIHGVGLVLNHIWKKKIRIAIPRILGWFITFNTINLSMIFFRATSLEDAGKVLSGMLGVHGVVQPESFDAALSWQERIAVALAPVTGDHATLLWLLAGFVLILGFKNSTTFLERFRPGTITALWGGGMFAFSVLSLDRISEFLYFNF